MSFVLLHLSYNSFLVLYPYKFRNIFVSDFRLGQGSQNNDAKNFTNKYSESSGDYSLRNVDVTELVTWDLVKLVTVPRNAVTLGTAMNGTLFSRRSTGSPHKLCDRWPFHIILL